ncbi:MAG: CDP-glycerol glycerophosphotransferase family protein [Coriobacteriia bacterium]|nr:CDP-glycerol glycerophosphotransferase family protein [Coriobacteriia bacterium]
MIVFLRKWVLRLAWFAFRPLPVRDRVVLASNHAERLRGNLRWVHDELLRQAPGTDAVLLLHRSVDTLAGKLATLATAIRAEYYLATSRVFIVDDYYFPLYPIRPKPGTTIVQTWHASGAFKKVGYSVAGKTFGASASLLRQVRIHANYTHCLVASRNAIPHYAEAFGQPEERFFVTGIPRTDLFFDPARRVRAPRRVRERYRLPDGKTIVLYAPTFRGDTVHEARYHDALDLELLADTCGADCVWLLRLHPFVATSAVIPEHLREFVVDVSDHPDINELMLASDVLVTDYSSAIFEFSLLERPMLFYAPDYEAYERERGFYFDYASDVPGPIFTTTAGLAEHIAAGRFDLGRVRAFRQRWFDVADGHASERVVRDILLPGLHPRA